MKFEALYPETVTLVAEEVEILVLKKINTGKNLQTETLEVKWQGWGQTHVIFTLTVMLRHFSRNPEQDMRDCEHRMIEGFIAALLANLRSNTC